MTGVTQQPAERPVWTRAAAAVVAAGHHHGRCRRPRLRVRPERAQHRIGALERREHARGAARAFANERRPCKPRHHVGPRVGGHAHRGGEHHPPDPSVGVSVPHGGQGRDPDAVLAAVAHELGDES